MVQILRNARFLIHPAFVQLGLDIEKGEEDAKGMEDVVAFVFSHQGTLNKLGNRHETQDSRLGP